MERKGRQRRKSAPTHGLSDRTHGVRLQKALADAGVAARRECEELILQGAVTVNGTLVDTLPAFVDPAEDRIEVYGRPLRKPEKHVYILLFKPRGTVCTNSDPEGRPRAIDLVRHPDRPRLYCVGRLDLDSSGLLVLTNDGEFANLLTHPRYGVTKGYDMVVDGSLEPDSVARLEREILADAGEGQRSSLRLLKRERDRTTLHLELCEHRNLQIRPLMLALGHPVKKLRRTSFGPLRLKGLAVGEWRELAPREVQQLRRLGAKAEAAPSAPPKPTRLAKQAAFEGKRRSERARTDRKLAASTKPASTDAPSMPAEAPAEPRVRGSGHPRSRSDARAPRRDEARAPRRDEARAPRRDEARAPRRDEARAPRRDDARAPRRDDARAPRRDDARAPRRDDARAPRRDEARAPRRDDARAPRGGRSRGPRRGGAR